MIKKYLTFTQSKQGFKEIHLNYRKVPKDVSHTYWVAYITHLQKHGFITPENRLKWESYEFYESNF